MIVCQPNDSATARSIECVDDVVSVKDSEQAIYGVGCVTLAGCDEFAEDPPNVLKGAKHSILVRGIHRPITLHSTTEVQSARARFVPARFAGAAWIRQTCPAATPPAQNGKPSPAGFPESWRGMCQCRK